MPSGIARSSLSPLLCHVCNQTEIKDRFIWRNISYSIPSETILKHIPSEAILKQMQDMYTPDNGSRLNGTATLGLEGRVPRLQKASHTASKSLLFSFVLDTFQAISVIFFLTVLNTRSRISDLWICR